MQSSEIRKLFLEYFILRQHEHVKSSPLIPKDDPTLLFTNAGMVQFKRVFLGEEKRPYSRATTCQKCMRAGGKHSDLENVGFTARHHTFFEMLGNFSFGDYFKREAIFFAWEFLTEYLKLSKEKLWVSVYKEDEEAANIWEREIGIPRERIVALGQKDNFWQMGDTGPCGPCSEIIVDQGEEFGCGSNCSVGCDCDRFLELWNLVFMQYSREKDGTLTPLPKPSIDTGMGLERITAIIQDKRTNFDTDLFIPLVSEICSELNVVYGRDKLKDISIRVIADHVRAATFLISEGLIPSNEGRGYVLRRIIRRAARHIRLLGKESVVLYKFVKPVVESLGEVYPEIVSEQERVEKIIRIEEERFSRTLDKAQKIFEDIVTKAKESASKIISGEDIFRLYDTYGLPIDLIKDMAHDSKMHIDEEGFLKELERQRQRARAAIQQQEIEIKEVYKKLISNRTNFVGYTDYEVETIIESIIKDGINVNFLEEGQEGEIFLKDTPFYAESGGQVGDTGWIISPYGKAEVLDTRRILGLHCHHVRVKEGVLSQGDKVFAKIDLERRKAIARNHTATHLLHSALRIVIGDHVKQAGSLVAPDRLRFDFTHFDALKPEEIKEIEKLVNEKILEDLPLQIETKSLHEALSDGAIALFEDKYEDTVRVVKIFGFSKELCGGTHCSSTGQIGSFYIVQEGSVASGIRRIEAITGMEAFRYAVELRDEIKAISLLLKTAEPLKSVERLLLEIKLKQQEIENLRDKILSHEIESIIRQAREIDGVKVIAAKLRDLEIKDLKLLSDKIRQKIQPAIILLTSNTNGQWILVLSVTKDLIGRYDASQLLKEITQFVGGKGGGKPDMAQGGCPDGSSIDKAIEIFYNILTKNLGG